jgi:zinc D-Ala-D-Ala carboxypeptidase
MQSKYFSDAEMRCKCGCGANRMDDAFMARLDSLREMANRPLSVSSGYRCENHPEEKKKDGSTTGAHLQGKAADLLVSGQDATRIIAYAHALGFTGIGVKQNGPMAGRFIHVDCASNEKNQPRPHLWSY